MISNKVSIVTASLNCEKTIERSLKSSLGQNYDHLEVIVVDGGSNDKTIDIISSISDQRLKKIIENDNGIYQAWNKAIDISSGDWICFVGGDDYWLNSNSISRLVEKSENTNYVSAKVRIVNEKTRQSEIMGKKWDKNLILKGMYVAHPGSLHRISLFKKRKFNSTYRIAGDHEFLIFNRHNIVASFLNDEIIYMKDAGVSRKKPFSTFLESFHAIKSNEPYGFFLGARFFLLITIKFFIRKLLNLVK